jgi:hypothetical protein
MRAEPAERWGLILRQELEQDHRQKPEQDRQRSLSKATPDQNQKQPTEMAHKTRRTGLSCDIPQHVETSSLVALLSRDSKVSEFSDIYALTQLIRPSAVLVI